MIAVNSADRSAKYAREGSFGTPKQTLVSHELSGSGAILGAYRRDAGRSGELITLAEASGLITGALRVQAMMVG